MGISDKIAKRFIVTALFFLLLGCIEGITFPTKFQFKGLYTALFHLPADQLKDGRLVDSWVQTTIEFTLGG